MTAQWHEFEINQGETFRRVLTFAGRDFTEASFRLRLHKGGRVILDATSTDGNGNVGHVDGQVGEVALCIMDTSAYDFQICKLTVDAIYTDSTDEPLAQGTLRVFLK